ncbi:MULTISPECIES: membrane protein [Streptacidiphilus]|uniref:Membrane-anchored protein n=1 Tax=Streptacidiphilus cavernicola TaxID=3342716 RepID=A0ABV6UL81_9ACTN|nr:membrane protein [Streptacidiphilus jeojiense]
MNKLPQITMAFWIMKVCATTLGETGGDLVSTTMKVGYAASSVILIAVFLGTAAVQLRARTFHPALYWTVILTTSTAGTTISDFMNRTAALGYATGALILLLALAALFTFWWLSGLTFEVARIEPGRGELVYWAAVLLSNTLGTSAGDFLADTSGLGFAGGTALIAGLLALIVLADRLTRAPKAVLFWAAFVLSRPLGANAGDFFSKPVALGGLGYGPLGASLILAATLAALLLRTTMQQRQQSPEPVG